MYKIIQFSREKEKKEIALKTGDKKQGGVAFCPPPPWASQGGGSLPLSKTL